MSTSSPGSDDSGRGWGPSYSEDEGDGGYDHRQGGGGGGYGAGREAAQPMLRMGSHHCYGDRHDDGQLKGSEGRPFNSCSDVDQWLREEKPDAGK